MTDPTTRNTTLDPTFTIITASWNNGRYLPSVIDSVLNQSFQDWEQIIIDDCSTDDSWEILSQVRDPRIRIHRHERNLGGAAAYNTALSMARGRYIATLDSDDQYLPDFLSKHVEHFAEDPGLSVSYSHVQEIDEEGQPCDEGGYRAWFNGTTDLNDPKSWLWQNRLCHGTAVITRKAHDVIGPMRPDFVFAPDWDLWIRCLAAGQKFGVIPEPLMQARVHRSNITKRFDSRLSLEYAKLSAEHLHPFLLAVDRADLVEENIELFFERPEFRDEDPAFAEEILAVLAGGLPHKTFAGALRRFSMRYGHQIDVTQFQAQRDAAVIEKLETRLQALDDRTKELTQEVTSLKERLGVAEDQRAQVEAQLNRIRGNRVYRLAAGSRRVMRLGRL